MEPERITFNYDYSKSFFQNLYCSIRDVKAQEKKDELKKRMRNKDRMEGSLEERKIKYIRAIF